MSDSISLSFSFKPTRGANGKPKPPPLPPDTPKGTVPRIAKLMALAHHFEDLRSQGIVHDYADLARLGGVSRARITQIMSLLNLAPDVQEHILYLPRVTRGHDPVTLRKVLPVAQEMDWGRQREGFGRLIIHH